MTPIDWIPKSLIEDAAVREIDRGEYLFRQGDAVDGIFAVERGRIRMSCHSADGHEALVYVARVGDVIIESALFDDVYHCDAVATERSRLRVFRRDEVLEALSAEPKVWLKSIEVLAEQLRRTRARLENRNIHSARKRVIHYILTHGRAGREVQLEGSLKELALDLGLSQETLYRTLARLKKDRIVQRTPGTLTLLKVPSSLS